VRRSELLLWLALFAAFSPVLAELAGSLRAGFIPWTLIVGPALLAILMLRGIGRAGTRSAAGPPLLVLGVLLQLLGIFAATWSLARLGLATAVVGLALYLGGPSLRVALLALGVVPVPVTLVNLYSPRAESLLLGAVCAPAQAVGLAVSCTGPVAEIGGERLELLGRDVGLPLAVVLAELGWYAGLVSGISWRRSVGRAGRFAAAVLVIQPAAVALALFFLATRGDAAARLWLDTGVAATCTLAVLLWSGATPRRSTR